MALILLLAGTLAYLASVLLRAGPFETGALEGIFWVCWVGFLVFILIDWWDRRNWDRSRAAGCCEVCGYDLRATPLRCPECGSTPSLRPLVRHTRLWEVPRERGWLLYASIGAAVILAMTLFWVKFR